MRRSPSPLWRLELRARSALRHRWLESSTFAALCLVYLFLRVLGLLPSWSSAIWDIFDTMLKVATLALAFFIWVNESYERWVSSLERRLCAVFRYRGEIVLRCDHAPLLGEADLRAFSQQIGAQMSGRRNLNFAINYHHENYLVEHAAAPGGAYRFHRTIFDLDEKRPFTRTPNSEGDDPDLTRLLETRRCLYWHAADTAAPQEIARESLPPYPPRSELEI